MDLLHPLPIREPPLPGESLMSLLRRTATAMGYDNVNLLTRLLGPASKLHQNFNQMGPGPSLDRLAILLHHSPEELLKQTVHCFASSLVLQPAGLPAGICDHKTALRFFVAQMSAVCPVCLAEDETPYERLLWSFRPLPVCLRHSCRLLSRCPGCCRMLPSSRKDLSCCRCGVHFSRWPSTNISAAALARARKLEDWLSSDCQSVPQLSCAATFWLVERLAASIRKTPAWLRRTAERWEIDDPTAPSELFCWTAAVEALESWPEHLFLFLDEFQRVVKNRTLSTGVGRSFGFFLRDTAYLETMGYSAPAAALRSYLLERFTAGHVNGKVLLFQSKKYRPLLQQRSWYTQTEAAEVLRLQKGTVVDLIRRGSLKGEVHSAGSSGRSIGTVSKSSVESLRRTLETGLGVNQVRHRLGIGRSQVLALIHAEFLSAAVRTRKGWVVPLESVRSLESLLQTLPRIGSDLRSWLTFRQATRIFGTSGLDLTQALALIRRGQIAARISGGSSTLRGLWVFRPDVEAQLPMLRTHHCQVHGYSLSQLAKVLLPHHPCREPVLKKWIRAGLLHAQRQSHTWRVSPSEVERFRAEYCLADEACAILQVSRSTLSRWERSGRLCPVYGKRTGAGAGFSLFRRVDLPPRLKRLRGASQSHDSPS